jgi:hypothetical protein
LKNFLADVSDRERTLKRGGGQNFPPLHEEQIENAEPQSCSESDRRAVAAITQWS